MVYPTMHSSAKVDHVINVRITHKTARVPLMESVAFKDKAQGLAEICALQDVEECLILQTCNRVEIFLVTGETVHAAGLTKEYLAKRAGENSEEATQAIEIDLDDYAVNHLLRITSGLESMVIGEDQVLNQVWDAFLEAEKRQNSRSNP